MNFAFHRVTSVTKNIILTTSCRVTMSKNIIPNFTNYVFYFFKIIVLPVLNLSLLTYLWREDNRDIFSYLPKEVFYSFHEEIFYYTYKKVKREMNTYKQYIHWMTPSGINQNLSTKWARLSQIFFSKIALIIGTQKTLTSIDDFCQVSYKRKVGQGQWWSLMWIGQN